MPKHQKFLRNILWVMGGLLALGAFVGAINDAIALIKWPIALAGTLLIFLGWVIIQVYLKHRPVLWKNANGNLVRVKKLGSRYSLFFVGMVILLWLPSSISWFESKGLGSYKIEDEREDEILIVIATFVRYEGVDDAKAQSELARAIKDASQDMDFSKIRVEIAPNELSLNELELANEIGAKYDASFIIIGDQTSVRISSYYLNLKFSSFRPDFGSEITYPLLDNKGYILTAQLPSQVVYRLFFDIGQTYFQVEKYDEALEVSLAALDFSLYQLSDEDLGAGYFFVGQIFEQQKNQAQAERYFCSSRNHDPTLTSEMNLDCIFPKPLK